MTTRFPGHDGEIGSFEENKTSNLKTKYHDPNSYSSNSGYIQASNLKMNKFIKECELVKQVNPLKRFFFFRHRKKRLTEHLLGGAPNAALVMTVEPKLIIAALSTDFDAAMLLEFKTELVSEYQLEVGKPLISINTYGKRTNKIQIDIIDGPASTFNYSMCYPIIGEFLATDINSAKKAASELPRAEYERLLELAKARLSESKPFIRKGNPFDSLVAPYQILESPKEPLEFA